MNNPWIELPDFAPYVLRNDADIVNEFNHKVMNDGKSDLKIQLDLLPEPFIEPDPILS